MESRQGLSFLRRKSSTQNEPAQSPSSQELPALHESQASNGAPQMECNRQVSQRTLSNGSENSTQQTLPHYGGNGRGQRSPVPQRNKQQRLSGPGQTSVWYRGARLNSSDMWTAVVTKNYDQLRKCLKAGLDPNFCRFVRVGDNNCNIRSVLDLAIVRDRAEAVAILLEAGADISGSTIARVMEDTESKRGKKWQDLVLVEEPYFPELPHYVAMSWLPAVHLAAFTGNLEVLKLILQRSQCDPDMLGSRSRTALHHCISGQNEDGAKMLLDYGANIEKPDNIGVTPLKGAALAGSIKMVRVFVERGARIEAVDKDGETAMHDAASRKRFEIVKFLLSCGAELEAKNKTGMTPFFTAASNFEKTTMSLLADHGADVDSSDKNGCTALIRAVMARNEPLASYLLDLGVDIEASDYDGWTAFDAAMIKDDDLLLSKLLSHSPRLSGCDSNGNTLLHRAAARGSSRLLRHLLTAQNRDPNVRNLQQETPLHIAASYGRHNTTRILLQSNANPNTRDVSSCTPLARAVAYGSFAVVRELAHKGAEFDQSSVSEKQPPFSQSAPAEQRNLIDRFMKANYPHVSILNQANLVGTVGRKSSITDFNRDTAVARMIEKQGHKMEITDEKLQTDPFVASIPEGSVPQQVINYIQNVQASGGSLGAELAGNVAGNVVGNVALAAISGALG